MENSYWNLSKAVCKLKAVSLQCLKAVGLALDTNWIRSQIITNQPQPETKWTVDKCSNRTDFDILFMKWVALLIKENNK